MTAHPARTIVRTLCALAMIVAGSASFHAQEAPLDLSLEEALRRGLANGEELVIATSLVDQAETQVREARSAALPQISGNVNYLYTIRTPFEFSSEDFGGGDGQEIDLPFGQDHTWSAAIGVNQVLWAAGKVGIGLDIAEQLVGAAAANRDESEGDFVLSVIEAYYDAVLAGRIAEVSTSAQDQAQAQLERVRLLREAGNASDLDVLRVEVERENLQPGVVEALNARDVALLNLLRLINLPPDTPVNLTDRLTATGFSFVTESRVDALIEQAIEQRGLVEAAERQTEIRRLQVDLARTDYLPTASLSANFGEVAYQGLPSFSDFRDDWSVGVNIRIPIYEGGRRKAVIAGAREELLQAEMQLGQLREVVALEVEQFRRELERTRALMDARAKSVESAERVYSLTRLAYDQGVATNLEIVDAREALRQARANEAQAIHAYYLALANLLRASGELEHDPIATVAATPIARGFLRNQPVAFDMKSSGTVSGSSR